MSIEENLKAIGGASKSLVLGVAIFILTMFVVVYGVNTFYESPEYEDYCGEFKTQEVIETEARCLEIGGQWNSYEIVREPGMTGYCDRDFTCRQDYETANEKYAKKVFIVAIPLGLLIIALGAFVFHLNMVGVGLMFGGVGTLIYGAGEYWQYSDNLIKFVISLIALVVLIWGAYWFNKRK